MCRAFDENDITRFYHKATQGTWPLPKKQRTRLPHFTTKAKGPLSFSLGRRLRLALSIKAKMFTTRTCIKITPPPPPSKRCFYGSHRRQHCTHRRLVRQTCASAHRLRRPPCPRLFRHHRRPLRRLLRHQQRRPQHQHPFPPPLTAAAAAAQ